MFLVIFKNTSIDQMSKIGWMWTTDGYFRVYWNSKLQPAIYLMNIS